MPTINVPFEPCLNAHRQQKLSFSSLKGGNDTVREGLSMLQRTAKIFPRLSYSGSHLKLKGIVLMMPWFLHRSEIFYLRLHGTHFLSKIMDQSTMIMMDEQS